MRLSCTNLSISPGTMKWLILTVIMLNAWWHVCVSSQGINIISRHGIEIICQKHHDDVIKWKHFPCYWPFVWGIHRSPVNSPNKVQWCRALMFCLICTWVRGWVNNVEASDLRHHHAHYDVIVMFYALCKKGYMYHLDWQGSITLSFWFLLFFSQEAHFFITGYMKHMKLNLNFPWKEND